MNTTRGFSLLELLIVMTIILILVGIAIPGYKYVMQSAHESAATTQLNSIRTMEVAYKARHDRFATIDDLVAEKLLDSRFGTAVSGYVYNISVSGGDYTATATPASTNDAKYGYVITSDDNVPRYQEAKQPTCDPCFPPNKGGLPVQ
jgi:prepilin-type N-terminal cleavage/methylation domain-containing protein